MATTKKKADRRIRAAMVDALASHPANGGKPRYPSAHGVKLDSLLRDMKSAADRAYFRGTEDARDLFEAAESLLHRSIVSGDAITAILAFFDCMGPWIVEQKTKDKAKGGKIQARKKRLNNVERMNRFDDKKRMHPTLTDPAIWRLVARDDLPQGATTQEIRALGLRYSDKVRQMLNRFGGVRQVL